MRFVAVACLFLCNVACGDEPGRQPLDPAASDLIFQANRAIEIQRYDAAIGFLTRLDAEYPGLPESTHTWGRVFFGTSQLEKADSAYQAVLKARPDEPGIYHNLGTVAFRAKQRRKALSYFMLEADRNPEPRPFHAMGLTYDKLAVADSARWAYEQAIALDSTFAESYSSLAKWYETSGDFERALDYAVRAHALEPSATRHETFKGRLLVRVGRYKDGIVVLSRILNRDPYDYRSGLALGRAWQMTGDNERAKAYIDRAEQARQVMQKIEAQMELLEDAPLNLPARVELAEALRRVGRVDQSILQYQIIEARVPSNLAIKANLATLYMMRGDTASATTRYRQILEQDSTVVEVWINLTQLYARNGQWDRAESTLSSAKRYGPQNEKVRSLESWVNKRRAAQPQR